MSKCLLILILLQLKQWKARNLIQPKKTAALVLENGEVLWGYSLGCQKAVIGEFWYNTSQTGYQEANRSIIYKQIITFTFPHIGIVGTNKEDQESKKFSLMVA